MSVKRWLRDLLAPLGFASVGVGLAFGVFALIYGDALRHVGFEEPLWFAAAAIPLLALGLRTALMPRPATMRFSRGASLRSLGRGVWAHLAELPAGLRIAAALCLVVALARPTSSRMSDEISREGIDIAIALDMSESMKDDDMYPYRLEAAKIVIDAFIQRRPRDRVALVAFGDTATTVAPLTMDHGVVRGLLKRLRLGVIDGSRTAIGAGLGMALNRLDGSETESKVVVLLTDGVHNADGTDPDSVAQEAAERGVLVYTILIGRQRGTVDPAQLERIASATGGYAYTAENQAALETSFQDLLDKLERSEVESLEIKAELFWWALWPAWIFLLLDVVLRNTRLRRFP